MVKVVWWQQAPSLLLGLFVGLSAGAALWSRAAPKPAKVPDVLRAHRFEVVDEKGVLRGRLATLTGGRTALQLFDTSGKEQVALDTTPEHAETVTYVPSGFQGKIQVPQETSLRLYDAQGRPRVILSATDGTVPKPGEEPKGQTQLLLFNPADRMNVKLSTTAPGEAKLEFGHETNRGTDVENSHRYAVLYSSMKEGVRLRLSGDGKESYEGRREGEAHLQLEGRNGSLALPVHKSPEASSTIKP